MKLALPERGSRRLVSLFSGAMSSASSVFMVDTGVLQRVTNHLRPVVARCEIAALTTEHRGI